MSGSVFYVELGSMLNYKFSCHTVQTNNEHRNDRYKHTHGKDYVKREYLSETTVYNR